MKKTSGCGRFRSFRKKELMSAYSFRQLSRADIESLPENSRFVPIADPDWQSLLTELLLQKLPKIGDVLILAI